MSSSIVLKVVFNGSAHRFTLTKPSMSDLIAQLKLSYPNLPADAHIKYEDDEQELITISTDNELMEAFNVAVAQGSRTLKLIVSTNNNASASAAAASASPVTPTPSSSSIVEDIKVASSVASRATSPASVRVSPAPKPVPVAATPSPKPAAPVAAAAPATPKPAAEPAKSAAAAAGEEHKLPVHDEIVELLLSLLKNTEFQAVLPQVLNAVLDEVSKPQRSVQAVVDRVLQFAAVRDHACTRRLLPFVDHVAPCADACLSQLNPGLVALARPFVPMAATLVPHAVAFLERLKAGAVECPLADVSSLLSGMGPCGLAGLAKMFGAPRTTAEGDVEFDLGAIPLPPFLASFLSGFRPQTAAEEGGCPRARSQPRGHPCGPVARGPCEHERGPCHADPRSQSVPRGGGCRRGFEGPRSHHGSHGGRHPHPHHGGFGPHGPHHGGPFPRGPCGPFAGPWGPFPGPHGFPHGPCGPFGGEGRCPRNRSAEMPATSAAEGEPHVWRNFACDGCNMHPITGIRYHCTICKDYDLCETCEAKGVHPRHHPLIKLHVPRPPPSDEQAVHHGVTCDMCHESPITGLRYKCTVCPDFDMCEKCEAKRLHPAEHPVIKLRTERHLPPRLPPFFQGEAAAPGAGSPSQCPRRGGGGGGRCRRFMAAAAAAAATASATAPAAACSSSSSACPETKEVPSACGLQQCGPCDPCGFEAPEATPSPIVVKGPQAVLVRHVTLAHGSKLEQGQVLVKTWSVQNNGQEAWPATTKLIFLRGDRELLGETEEFSVLSAQPGQTVEISVPITTPTKAGNYTAYFQLSDQDRNVFGPRLWLEVMVTRDEEDERKLAPAPVATSSLSAVSASAPAVDTSGWVDVKVESSPVIKPAVAAPAAVPAASLPAPASASAPTPSAPSAPVKPVAVAASAPPAKYAAQLASLSSMGFNNAELNAFLLEKHNGDIQQVTNWLLENMNH